MKYTLTVLAAASVLSAMPADAETNAPAPRAVQCVSAFELMDRAAPNWMAQEAVRGAQADWMERAEHLSIQAEVDLGTQLNREMTRLANITTKSPQSLTDLAMNCVAEAG